MWCPRTSPHSASFYFPPSQSTLLLFYHTLHLASQPTVSTADECALSVLLRGLSTSVTAGHTLYHNSNSKQKCYSTLAPLQHKEGNAVRLVVERQIHHHFP